MFPSQRKRRKTNQRLFEDVDHVKVMTDSRVNMQSLSFNSLTAPGENIGFGPYRVQVLSRESSLCHLAECQQTA